MTTTDIESEAVTILGSLQHLSVLDRHRVLRLCFERAGDALAKERDAAAKLLEELDAAMGGEPATVEKAPPKLTDEARKGIRRSIYAEMDEHRDGDSMPWTCGQIANAVMLEGAIVSPELRVMVKEGSLIQTGRHYAPAPHSPVAEDEDAEDSGS